MLYSSIAVCGVFLCTTVLAHSTVPTGVPDAVSLLPDRVSDAAFSVLQDDLPSAVPFALDRGRMAADERLEHVKLVLRRPEGRQAALDRLARAQLDRRSPLFRQWLQPADLARFAPSGHDLAVTQGWLAAHGLHVDTVSPTGVSMDVSGPVAAFEATFRTTMHRFTYRGKPHLGPASAPEIPRDLQPVIRGITLGNFFPRPALQPVGGVEQQANGRWRINQASPDFTIQVGNGEFQGVAPYDFFTIYDVLPVFYDLSSFGISQKVALIEQSDMQPQDYNTFNRKFFVLPNGKLTQVHPGGCADPGLADDESEAALDAEWAATTSSNADIEINACMETPNTFGVMTAFQGLIEEGTDANIVSVSYGGCERLNGIAFTEMWNMLAEEGAVQGLSIFVSSGDSGPAACDAPTDQFGAQHGPAVNALAASPYVTAVGGTDFGDTYRGLNSQYWGTPADNSAYTKASALSYIPEIPWNNSCAGSIVTKYLGNASPAVTCSNAEGGTDPFLLNITGSGGGASAVFTKPDWQSLTIPGVPNDGARDLPDVSLFAGNGLWNHFYVFCNSDLAHGGAPCRYPDHGTTTLLSAAGGTSFGAPALAGLQALTASYVQLHEYHKVEGRLRLGNAAPRFYQIAQAQLASQVLDKSCKSDLGNKTGTSCVFHEITTGDTEVFCSGNLAKPYCQGIPPTYQSLLSAKPNRFATAYPARLGYGQAVGLGSLDVYNWILNY